MSKPIIHFAHANGFPARTYTKLFSLLSDQFDVEFIERHAHDPKFPVTDNWLNLSDELIAEIESKYSEPIIGVGHSLGGILHFLSAVEKPHLYKEVILLDAPIISRIRSHGIKVLKLTKLIDRYSPSQITRNRRRVWRNKEEAFEHFSKKEKFAAFDLNVLHDYVAFGTVETEKGVELFFDPRVEAHIYRTIPHVLPDLSKKLRIPITYVGGNRSREGRLAGMSLMKNHSSINIIEVNGSHLFPMENPQETAVIIAQILNKKK